MVADVCEGIGDCRAVCPEACMRPAYERNARGTFFTRIDGRLCTACGACLTVCPIEGAILPYWRPELQRSGEHERNRRALVARFGPGLDVERLLAGRFRPGDPAGVVRHLLGEPARAWSERDRVCWGYEPWIPGFGTAGRAHLFFRLVVEVAGGRIHALRGGVAPPAGDGR